MSQETPVASAYELLSKPTLSLTPAEVKATIEELRKRRHLVLQTGKPDTTVKEAKAARAPKAEKPTDLARKEAAKALLTDLDLEL